MSRLWDERRLAFPIRGQRKGAYWLTYFRLEAAKVGMPASGNSKTNDVLWHLYDTLRAVVEHLERLERGEPWKE